MHAHRLVAFAHHGFALTRAPDAQMSTAAHPCQALQALHDHRVCTQHGMCVRADHIMIGNFVQNAAARKDTVSNKRRQLQDQARDKLNTAERLAKRRQQSQQTPPPPARRNPYAPDPACSPRAPTRLQRAQQGLPRYGDIDALAAVLYKTRGAVRDLEKAARAFRSAVARRAAERGYHAEAVALAESGGPWPEFGAWAEVLWPPSWDEEQQAVPEQQQPGGSE